MPRMNCTLKPNMAHVYGTKFDLLTIIINMTYWFNLAIIAKIMLNIVYLIQYGTSCVITTRILV